MWVAQGHAAHDDLTYLEAGTGFHGIRQKAPPPKKKKEKRKKSWQVTKTGEATDLWRGGQMYTVYVLTRIEVGSNIFAHKHRIYDDDHPTTLTSVGQGSWILTAQLYFTSK